MHPDTVIQFFLWCSVINTGLLIFWTLIFAIVPDWVARTQQSFFPIPKEQLTIILYCFIGFFKVMVIVFNWVPYFALKLMT